MVYSSLFLNKETLKKIIKMHNSYVEMRMKIIAFMVAFKTIQASRGHFLPFINTRQLICISKLRLYRCVLFKSDYE